jgi:hypothetical protein
MLTIAYSAKHHVNARFADCLMTAIPQLDDLSPTIKSIIGKSNIAHARSMLLTEWYDKANPYDSFMFIDTDQTFTANDIRQVVNLSGDLKAGLYANRAQQPTSQLSNKSNEAHNVDVLYAATGFLCFTYSAVKRIHEYMKTVEKLDRVIISDGIPGEDNCIPFFHPLIETIGTKKYWLGEDFSFSSRARKANLSIKGIYLQTLGHEIPFIIYTKPPLKTWPKKSIVYYCGDSRAQFSPNQQNLGGSEQGVVYLSKELAANGYTVTVFGKISQNIIHEGVEYKSFTEFNPDETFDTIILWRRYGLDALSKIKNAQKIVVDLHDPTSKTAMPEDLINSRVTTIFVKSEYHRSLYPQFPDSKFSIVANGLRLPTENQQIKRSKSRFCYTSSYDRGLIEILKYLWPKIKAAVPEATFHIYYGNALLQDDIKTILEPLLKQPGVFEHGRINYDEIHKEHQMSIAKLYISDTPLEIDCLSVREAAAAGCIPIMSTAAVFSERAGIHIEGDIKSERIWIEALDTILKLYNLPDTDLENFQLALKEAALKQTWAQTAQKWIQVIC